MQQQQVTIQKPARNRKPGGKAKGANEAEKGTGQSPKDAPAQQAPEQQQAQQEASKPAEQPQTQQQAPAQALPIAYGIADYARPKAGAALFAHTRAFLELSGIIEGKAYPKAKATQVIGATAVKYHSANGNLAQTADGLTLTEKGKAFFAARGETDKELHAAFVKVLTTGQLDDRANVKAESSRFALK